MRLTATGSALACAAALLALVSMAARSASQSALPAGFVYLRDIDPTIVQDIRYASSDNFVGRPLAGYGAPECILRREAAVALQRVQADLRVTRLGLKVYDCYRPQRAVRAMVQWASDGRADGSSKRFYPKVEKHALFTLGFIAARSRHSAGTAVDLTLIDAARSPAAGADVKARYGPCTGPAAERGADDSIDMGTGYDCFDMKSYTASATLTADQQKSRQLLLAMMARHGFKNYFREWWHFTYANAAPAGHYDFPISPRQARPPSH